MAEKGFYGGARPPGRGGPDAASAFAGIKGGPAIDIASRWLDMTARPGEGHAKEGFYDAAWRLGHRLHKLAKRAGLLGPLEPGLTKLAPLLVHPPTQEVRITLHGGMHMAVPPGFPSARSYASGIYEIEVTQLFRNLVGEGMTVVDLGANVGYYTLLASRLVGRSGQVFAFEPDPRNYAYLLRNLAASGCSNVLAVEKAVSSRTGSGLFVPDRGGAEGWLSDRPNGHAPMVVKTTTLDDFFSARDWPSVDVVKMDIEGGEKAALQGMREFSMRNPDMSIIMEFNPRALRRSSVSPRALAAMLRGLGYLDGHIIERGMKSFSGRGGLPRTHATYDLLYRGQTWATMFPAPVTLPGTTRLRGHLSSRPVVSLAAAPLMDPLPPSGVLMVDQRFL